MKLLTVGLAALALVATGGAAHAQDWMNRDRWAVGVTAGSDGLGGDLKYSLSPQIVLRARGAGLGFSHSENDSGIHYAGKVKFATGGAFVDWHPFSNGFLLSGGVVGGDRKVDLSGSPTGNVTLFGNTYTPAQIGSVTGRAKLDSAAGFLGLGYDSTFSRRGPIGISVLAGVQLSSSPKVRLSSTGLLATTPQLQADLVKEEAQLRDDLKFARYYPAISVGLSYRF